MLRCSGCDLNRACKSPFSRTQHARSSSSHKHQQLSTVERGRLVWTGYVPVDVVVPKKVRSKRETTSDGPPHPTIHPTIPRPPTFHSHSSPMPRDSWWVPLLENRERAIVSMQPSFSRVSLPRKVLLSIHGLPTLRLVLSLSDQTATHENSKGKETTPIIHR